MIGPWVSTVVGPPTSWARPKERWLWSDPTHPTAPLASAASHWPTRGFRPYQSQAFGLWPSSPPYSHLPSAGLATNTVDSLVIFLFHALHAIGPCNKKSPLRKLNVLVTWPTLLFISYYLTSSLQSVVQLRLLNRWQYWQCEFRWQCVWKELKRVFRRFFYQVMKFVKKV